jgi:cation:H+ antiporter
MFPHYQSLLLNIPLLIIGFFLLNRGSGMLVDGASSLARRFGVAESVIHFSIVALGTSFPKLFTNILAAKNGYFDLVIGNIIGSNIFNLLGIVGITGLSRPIRSSRYTLFLGIPLSIISYVLFFLLANERFPFRDPGGGSYVFSKSDSIFLLIGFVMFMTYAYFNVRKHHGDWFADEQEPLKYYPAWFAVILFLVGIIGLCAGAILVVDNLIDVSRKFDMSQRFLGQFVLAFGGSISMLWWTLKIRASRTRTELSSIIGTNVLNILGMLGLCALLNPVQYNTRYNLDIYLLMGISLLIMAFLWMGKKLLLKKWKCQVLVALLVLYAGYLFLR